MLEQKHSWLYLTWIDCMCIISNCLSLKLLAEATMCACQFANQLPEFLKCQFPVIVLIQGAHELVDHSRIAGILQVISKNRGVFVKLCNKTVTVIIMQSGSNIKTLCIPFWVNVKIHLLKHHCFLPSSTKLIKLLFNIQNSIILRFIWTLTIACYIHNKDCQIQYITNTKRTSNNNKPN